MQSRLKGYSSTFADLCALGRAIMLIVVDGSDQDYTAQVPNQLLAYCAELGIALEVEVLVEP